MQRLVWLESPLEFPDTRWAWSEPNGLLAASADINSDWLVHAYSRGIFPWYSQGEPVLWWSPSPRAVLYTGDFKLHRSLSKTIKHFVSNPLGQIRMNTQFESVMRACAAPRAGQSGTWISEEVISAYCELHALGLAHSVEHWQGNELVGGLYCVALGGMIYGESMFSRQTDASKIAFAHWVYWLKTQDVHIIDCQQATRHLMSFGAREIDRSVFEHALSQAQNRPGPRWYSGVLPWLASAQ